MDITEEDFFSGMSRLRKMLGAADIRTVEVLACHAALEKELDLALAALLPRADKLKGLSYVQKVSLFQATCHEDAIDDYAKPLIAFNDLRNAVAHGGKRSINGTFKALCTSFETSGGKLDERDATIVGIATALMRVITLLVKEEGYDLEVG